MPYLPQNDHCRLDAEGATPLKEALTIAVTLDDATARAIRRRQRALR